MLWKVALKNSSSHCVPDFKISIRSKSYGVMNNRCIVSRDMSFTCNNNLHCSHVLKMGQKNKQALAIELALFFLAKKTHKRVQILQSEFEVDKYFIICFSSPVYSALFNIKFLLVRL